MKIGIFYFRCQVLIINLLDEKYNYDLSHLFRKRFYQLKKKVLKKRLIELKKNRILSLEVLFLLFLFLQLCSNLPKNKRTITNKRFKKFNNE